MNLDLLDETDEPTYEPGEVVTVDEMTFDICDTCPLDTPLNLDGTCPRCGRESE